jgi:hypothetical protein
MSTNKRVLDTHFALETACELMKVTAMLSDLRCNKPVAASFQEPRRVGEI